MAIDIEKLTKIYSGNVVGVKDINLTIDDGGMFGLLGRNGAGKTTFLRILSTLIHPTEGKVNINGFDAGKNKRKVRKLIGYLPQNFGVYPELSAYEFLDYMGLLYEIKDDTKRNSAVIRTLEMVHLDNVKDRRLKTFSRGMIQRIGIAQALLNSPEILLVDEPTANLDPEERVKFRNLLSESSDGKIVIISTHIVNDIANTCNDMAILDEGELKYHGSPGELLRRAEGKVFELEIDSDQLEQAKKKHTIISTIRGKDKTTLRVVSEDKLSGGSETKPTLEDAYILMMKEC